ncbi:RAMP superfamily CRISPR-associated protein [cf. Phormidesmis sp. LEGE 11477]|uniref:RAMP superfamily CRISPR-associated protein n=1 Tax=cf. Phormidesmis sp. LEGE 11477 TaxID=1828680 RepID=UPI0018809C82|nr:RAMP superfamily CRISPR-associated protein [cf. Phormidesmis sp. LEGE 11477]MBE9063115.1 CRISPR-associated protein [cf. Phormidesmis sp. LEGE 11477]
MHKRFVNQCTLDIRLIPKGPVLIKSGKEGADPTKPDMEFVETYHAGGRSIYFPGSSLKGAIRAHAERIVRTIGSDRRPTNLDPAEGEARPLWASDPLKKETYKYIEKEPDAQKVYRWSSFTDQLFGSVAIASRLRIEDAYPIDIAKVKTEERNGVAIDRVFGSVAVGPFNYQVCTAGEFQTKIHLKNFTLEQLGLLGLVLRDLNDGWFGLGFAKSRGMGLVEVRIAKATVDYPGCVLKGEQISLLGSQLQPWSNKALIGAGVFLPDAERQKYGFPANDIRETTVIGQSMDYGLGVQLTWDETQIGSDLFTPAVTAWKDRLMEGVAS